VGGSSGSGDPSEPLPLELDPDVPDPLRVDRSSEPPLVPELSEPPPSGLLAAGASASLLTRSSEPLPPDPSTESSDRE
jgi:hypothetical protein